MSRTDLISIFAGRIHCEHVATAKIFDEFLGKMLKVSLYNPVYKKPGEF